jgi:hypothetical protein
MGAHPDVPEDVLDAAIAAAGEVRRYYPHGDGDFRTDVSHMLVAALRRFVNPIPASSRYGLSSKAYERADLVIAPDGRVLKDRYAHQRPETD